MPLKRPLFIAHVIEERVESRIQCGADSDSMAAMAGAASCRDSLHCVPLRCDGMEPTSGAGAAVCGNTLVLHDGISKDLYYTPRTQKISVQFDQESQLPIIEAQTFRRTSRPKATAYSAAFAVADDTLLVFGGAQDGFVFSDEFSSGTLDCKSEPRAGQWPSEWRQLRDGGDSDFANGPSGRCSAACTQWVSEGALLLFGGLGPKWSHYNDVWMLDADTLDWECLHPGGTAPDEKKTSASAAAPEPGRSAESATAAPRTTAVEASSGSGGKPTSGPSHCTGGTPAPPISRSKSTSIQQFGSCAPPHPRRQACSCLLGDRYMAVLGGKDTEGTRLGARELRLFDLEGKEWYQLVATGESPPPFSGAVCLSLPDVEVWPDQSPDGSGRSASATSSAALAPGINVMRCVVLCGEMEDGAMTDAFVLHLLDTGEQLSERETSSAAEAGTKKESAVTSGGAISSSAGPSSDESEIDEPEEVHVLRAHWTKVSLLPRGGSADLALASAPSPSVDLARRSELVRTMSSGMWVHGALDAHGSPVGADPWTQPNQGSAGPRPSVAGTAPSHEATAASSAAAGSGDSSDHACAGVLLFGGEVAHPPSYLRPHMREDPTGPGVVRSMSGQHSGASSSSSSSSSGSAATWSKPPVVVPTAGQKPVDEPVELDETGRPKPREKLCGTSGLREGTVLASPEFVLWDERVACRGLAGWVHAVLHSKHIPHDSPVLRSILGHHTLPHSFEEARHETQQERGERTSSKGSSAAAEGGCREGHPSSPRAG